MMMAINIKEVIQVVLRIFPLFIITTQKDGEHTTFT